MNELFATLSSFPLILLLLALVIDVIQTLEIITQDARSLLPVAKSRLASELILLPSALLNELLTTFLEASSLTSFCFM